jgi:dihydrofolate reductase
MQLIVAHGKNLEIGSNNQLLCHLPNDLKNFSAKTKNMPHLIMGRSTWRSLPMPVLPGRIMHVVSKSIVLALNSKEDDSGGGCRHDKEDSQ